MDRQQNFTSAVINDCLNQTNYLAYLVDVFEAKVDNDNKALTKNCGVEEAYKEYAKAMAAKIANDITTWYDTTLTNYVDTVNKDYSSMNHGMLQLSACHKLTCYSH